MKKLPLKLPPASAALYERRMKQATPEILALARILPRLAFVDAPDVTPERQNEVLLDCYEFTPSPVYLAQASAAAAYPVMGHELQTALIGVGLDSDLEG